MLERQVVVHNLILEYRCVLVVQTFFAIAAATYAVKQQLCWYAADLRSFLVVIYDDPTVLAVKRDNWEILHKRTGLYWARRLELGDKILLLDYPFVLFAPQLGQIGEFFFEQLADHLTGSIFAIQHGVRSETLPVGTLFIDGSLALRVAHILLYFRRRTHRLRDLLHFQRRRPIHALFN